MASGDARGRGGRVDELVSARAARTRHYVHPYFQGSFVALRAALGARLATPSLTVPDTRDQNSVSEYSADALESFFVTIMTIIS